MMDALEGAAVPPETCRQLQIIALAMAGGLVLMAGLVVWSYLNAAVRSPTSIEVKSINTLTTVIMVATLLAIVASEVAWRAILRRTSGALGTRVQTAYIVRLALREGSALLGMTVAYVAALSGVLRLYPAYWVDLAPFGLFLLFLATHWPTAERLSAEARDSVV